ncbi:MAG TPA: polyphosphate polymerase domain-containing protein [Bryobacteraceae bacterium]|nr:polyphosphate polymerase domain-containing protein [Bryobacteraceae bacterium]
MSSSAASKAEMIQVARSEYKYRIRAAELPALRNWLLRYCTPDENSRSGEWYAIRSLYLDNAEFRMFQDAKQKAAYRLKLRARAYGEAQGSIKLEVKRRVRDLIVKTSATAQQSQWREASPLGLPGFHALSKPSMAEFLQLAESMHATPKMLVYYERQAFSSFVDDYVRVTFDRNVACQPMNSWDLTGDPRHWLSVDAPTGFGESESTYILEVKFLDAPPAWLRDMVLYFGLQRRGGSKYVKSIQRALLYRDPAWDLEPNWRARVA